MTRGLGANLGRLTRYPCKLYELLRPLTSLPRVTAMSDNMDTQRDLRAAPRTLEMGLRPSSSGT